VSQENVDLAQSIVSDWARGDFSSAAWAHPQIEFVIADGPSPGTWTGWAGMADGWRAWLTAWSDVTVASEGCRALDDERVVVLVHAFGRGKESGLKIEEIWRKRLTLFYVRGGTVTRLVVYLDRDRALADLGLRE
jgi:hypothetical protein